MWCGRDAAQSGDALRIDVVFPILHGPNGEDGTVQGALELADVPFVGSSVTGSAVAMDKDIAKRLMRDAGLPIVPFMTTTASCRIDYSTAVAALGTADLFVKPANMGSSVGVSRAGSADEFAASCELALRYDHKALVERALSAAREIECSVLEELRRSPSCIRTRRDCSGRQARLLFVSGQIHRCRRCRFTYSGRVAPAAGPSPARTCR